MFYIPVVILCSYVCMYVCMYACVFGSSLLNLDISRNVYVHRSRTNVTSAALFSCSTEWELVFVWVCFPGTRLIWKLAFSKNHFGLLVVAAQCLDHPLFMLTSCRRTGLVKRHFITSTYAFCSCDHFDSLFIIRRARALL